MSETTGVQAVFSSDAARQGAVSRLMSLGFDRADLTMGGEAPELSTATRSSPATESDTRQTRTMATSMAATAGAFAAAGLTIATGGATAVAAGAAVAAGLGAGGLTNLSGTAASKAATDQVNSAATPDGLALIVRTRSADQITGAENALREAGGHDVVRLIEDQSIHSSDWTG